MKESNLFSALDSIKADDGFRERLKNTLKAHPGKRKWRRYAAAIAASLLLIGGAVYYFADSASFKIIERIPDSGASYGSVVYLDGYGYYISDWHNQCSEGLGRDRKLGEITLDLKGLLYTGIPPSFSGTFDQGTEIYSIPGFKPQYAILAVQGSSQQVLFRESKEGEEPKLSTDQVIAMIAGNPTLAAVELLDEENGGLMAVTEGTELLTLFDQGLTGQPILFQDDVHESRIPLNLVFQGGEILHLQVYPKVGRASVFGGLISLPPELVAAIQEFWSAGSQYRTIDSLLPPGAAGGYLQFKRGPKEIVADEESQAWGYLRDRFSYWRLEELDQWEHNGAAAFSLRFGRSEEDSDVLLFHDVSEGIVLEYEGKLYRLVRNRLIMEQEIENALLYW